MPPTLPVRLLLTCACLTAISASAAPPQNPPLTPERLTAGATLIFDLQELGASAHSNGKAPIRVQVRVPLNWDKEHAFPVWVHLAGEDGYDEKGLGSLATMFDQKNVILMTVDFPKDGYKKGLPVAVTALKRFAFLTKAKLDTANLCLSGVSYGARAMEANAQAGGRELAAFRLRVIAGGGDLDGLGQNPGPPAHWLQVGKKPLKVLDVLTRAHHDCTTEETTQTALGSSQMLNIRAWLTTHFEPIRTARKMVETAEKAKDPKEKIRLLAPADSFFLDFPDIQKAKELLADAKAQVAKLAEADKVKRGQKP